MKSLIAILLLVPSSYLAYPQDDKPAKIKMVTTAYCTCELCCEKWSGGGKTSIGKDASICNGVAAAPKLLPYHTRLDIPGIGIREVDDTGGAMRKDARKGIYHIDIRMKSHKEALAWGRKVLLVTILPTTDVDKHHQSDTVQNKKN